jgi:putative FmdB family regulatory protein
MGRPTRAGRGARIREVAHATPIPVTAEPGEVTCASVVFMRDESRSRRRGRGYQRASLSTPRTLVACTAVPIYEYRCPNGHVFELFQRFDDPPPDGCDICDAGPVTKILYPAAVHFKGSGFYSTDYGRGSRKKEAGKEGAAADGGGEAKEAKESQEKKPDAGSKQAAEA